MVCWQIFVLIKCYWGRLLSYSFPLHKTKCIATVAINYFRMLYVIDSLTCFWKLVRIHVRHTIYQIWQTMPYAGYKNTCQNWRKVGQRKRVHQCYCFLRKTASCSTAHPWVNVKLANTNDRQGFLWQGVSGFLSMLLSALFTEWAEIHTVWISFCAFLPPFLIIYLFIYLFFWPLDSCL